MIDTHSLKDFDDTLRIQVQANMKKKQRNDTIIAYATVDLALVVKIFSFFLFRF